MSPKAEKVPWEGDWERHSLGLVLLSVCLSVRFFHVFMFQTLDLTLSWHQRQSQEDTEERMAEARAKRAHRNPSFI